MEFSLEIHHIKALCSKFKKKPESSSKLFAFKYQLDKAKIYGLFFKKSLTKI